MIIIVDFGTFISFSHKTIFKPIFLNNNTVLYARTVTVYSMIYTSYSDTMYIGNISHFAASMIRSLRSFGCPTIKINSTQ